MTFDAATFLLALTNLVAFLLTAWGALLVAWGGAKAVRRIFWTEAEPWKGPQVPRLDDVRRTFVHRILLGVAFFLAGDLIRLLVEPALSDLIRLGTIAALFVVLSLLVNRGGGSSPLTVKGVRPSPPNNILRLPIRVRRK